MHMKFCLLLFQRTVPKTEWVCIFQEPWLVSLFRDTGWASFSIYNHQHFPIKILVFSEGFALGNCIFRSLCSE